MPAIVELTAAQKVEQQELLQSQLIRLFSALGMSAPVTTGFNEQFNAVQVCINESVYLLAEGMTSLESLRDRPLAPCYLVWHATRHASPPTRSDHLERVIDYQGLSLDDALVTVMHVLVTATLPNTAPNAQRLSPNARQMVARVSQSFSDSVFGQNDAVGRYAHGYKEALECLTLELMQQHAVAPIAMSEAIDAALDRFACTVYQNHLDVANTRAPRAHSLTAP